MVVTGEDERSKEDEQCISRWVRPLASDEGQAAAGARMTCTAGNQTHACHQGQPEGKRPLKGAREVAPKSSDTQGERTRVVDDGMATGQGSDGVVSGKEDPALKVKATSYLECFQVTFLFEHHLMEMRRLCFDQNKTCTPPCITCSLPEWTSLDFAFYNMC
jgi:hypothetical protein